MRTARLLALVLFVLCPLAARAARIAAPHPFGIDDLLRLQRLGGVDVSRDGKLLAYAVSTVFVDENKTRSALWLAPIGGGEPRQLTQGQRHDSDPRFSPDGRTLAFVSDRDGEPQIYLLDLRGGEPRKLTQAPLGVDSFLLSPDGKYLVYAASVFPECADDACNQKRAEHLKKPPSSGRIMDRLLYRHWDSWTDGKRSHLFRIDLAGGKAQDLTPGNYDTPPYSVGGGVNYDISPDAKTIVYASNHDAVEAASTNSDLWEIPAQGGPARLLTGDNPGYDGSPRYSPDGRLIALRTQRTPGYESDRWELRVYDRRAQKLRSLTADFDAWVEDFAWTPDSRRLYFAAPDRGRIPIYAVSADGGKVELAQGGDMSASDLFVLPDGALVYRETSLTHPAEIVRRASGRAPERVTHLNDQLLADVQMGQVRERWFMSKDGTKVHALVVVPPGFDEKKPYPALLWVHGGPQGAWQHGWSNRWNPQVLASAGYVVYLPNPRGSSGYGQDFVRGVSGDWGGKVYEDLMRATDDLESLPYVQKGRVGAAGASFGGFMINWFQGHTDRFKALFCHDGISDQEAMYGTEELWFPEWEFKGKPWESPEYRKWSPMTAAANFKTPEMIVHGEKDYRVPVEQAYLMFSLLQRRGVPSRLLIFPDENHWVLKPANSRLWYAAMIDWFHKHLGGAPADPKMLETATSLTK